ncbi:MAG: hypothetical protein Q4G04_02445 [bacterium]|nr:hypothetical protein [bacterium]
MFCNQGMRQEMPFGGGENFIDIDINNAATASANATVMPSMMAQPQMSSCASPIVEAGQERVIHRNFVHEVPQD